MVRREKENEFMVKEVDSPQIPKIEQIGHEEFKTLLGKAPEGNFDLGNKAGVVGFSEKADIVTLLFPKGGGVPDMELAMLKQKGKISLGNKSIILDADTTAVQIVKLIWEKGQEPEGIVWNGNDRFLVKGDHPMKGRIAVNNFSVTIPFNEARDDVLTEVRGLNPLYGQMSLSQIGKDLCEKNNMRGTEKIVFNRKPGQPKKPL